VKQALQNAALCRGRLITAFMLVGHFVQFIPSKSYVLSPEL